MNRRRVLMTGTMVFSLLAVFSGQACPPNGDDMLPAPAPIPGPPGDQGPPGEMGLPGTDATVTAGNGVIVENGVVSLDTNFTDGLYWKLDGNAATTAGTNFLGTSDNQPLELHVNGARALRLEPTTSFPNIIGGFDGNTVAAGAKAATIAVGGPADPTDPTTGNRVFDDFGTIGGGANNSVGSDNGDPTNARFATIGGGKSNTASSASSTVGGGFGNEASNFFTTVGGGFGNKASGEDSTVGGGQGNEALALLTTVSGGQANIADGLGATIGGGAGNTAAGTLATVPGGSLNEAAGNFSFAAGRRAKATRAGSFVWGDSTDADLTSPDDNTLTVRASGGTIFFSSGDQSTGVLLPAGDSAWTTVSDRNAKENFARVDGRKILERLTAIPIETWNYKAQNDAIRHIGPMAQDFYAAFGMGHGDKRISTIDTDGVALAAIQGLHQLVLEKDAALSAQRQRIEKLEARLKVIEALIADTKENSK